MSVALPVVILSLNASQVIAGTNNGNVMCHWMATRVLEAREAKQRVAIVSKLIAAGAKMLALHNYNGVMQVVSALSSAAVARLRGTMAALSRGSKEQLEQLKVWL
jgi:son of sevenless-like protein